LKMGHSPTKNKNRLGVVTHTSIISTLRRLMSLEDCEFEASLGNIAKSCLRMYNRSCLGNG
jgi:hypothetical protein